MSKKNLNKYLIVDADNCSGCRICELICSMVKSGEYNPQKSHIKLIRNREMDVNVATIDMDCDFCATCAKWCPNEALAIVDAQAAAIIRKKNKIGKFPVPLAK
jgi:carbon-monoxide dehydrogenase iron sulfur subunit